MYCILETTKIKKKKKLALTQIPNKYIADLKKSRYQLIAPISNCQKVELTSFT